MTANRHHSSPIIRRHANQINQLSRLNSKIHAQAAKLIRLGMYDEAINVVLAAMQNLHQRAIDEAHEANHIYEGFARAPGDGGTEATDYDKGPIPEYMRMLAQEMDRRSQVDENRQPKNVGDDISRMLGQPIQAEEDDKIKVTETQKARGLTWALGSQQPPKAKGAIPAAWL